MLYLSENVENQRSAFIPIWVLKQLKNCYFCKISIFVFKFHPILLLKKENFCLPGMTQGQYNSTYVKIFQLYYNRKKLGGCQKLKKCKFCQICGVSSANHFSKKASNQVCFGNIYVWSNHTLNDFSKSLSKNIYLGPC